MTGRYVYCPMTAKRIGRRVTLMDRIRRRRALRNREMPDVCMIIGYNAPVYQIFSDSLLVQFDGEQVTGVYDFHADPYLRSNLAKTIEPERIAPMTDYLKAYIQQYIHRMVNDELTVK